MARVGGKVAVITGAGAGAGAGTGVGRACMNLFAREGCSTTGHGGAPDADAPAGHNT